MGWLLNPLSIVYFSVAGMALGLISSYMFSDKIQHRLGVKVFPFVGGAVAMLIHGILIISTGNFRSFVGAWISGDLLWSGIQLWWLYPVVLAIFIAFVLLQYFDLKDAITVKSSWTAENPQKLGYYFPLSIEFQKWGKAVWHLFFAFFLILLPCAIGCGYIEYVILRPFSMGMMLLTLIPSLTVVIYALLFALDWILD